MRQKIDNSDIYILNVLRGISALLVVGNHLRSAMFMPFSELDDKTGYFFYFMTSLGHQSVIVFFVISGYLVGGGVLKKGKAFDLQEYIISRFVRLYVVLIPGLLLTFIVDYFTNIFNPHILTGGYNRIFNSGPIAPIDSSIYSLAINLLFLQDIFGPIFGSNGPLWSLAYEFQYYLIFPALLILIGEVQKSFLWRIFTFLAVIFIVQIYSKELFFYFPIWILGAISSKLAANKFRPGLALLSGLIFIIALFFSKLAYFNLSAIVNDYILSIAVTFLIFSMKTLRQRYLNKHAIFLADISFTQYIMHFPIVLCIAAKANYKGDLIPSVGNYGIYLFWLIGIVILSRVIWWIFERRTNNIRSYVQERISKF